MVVSPLFSKADVPGHDLALNSIFTGLKPFIPSGCDVYTDLDNLQANDNPPATIPPSILSTALRPGMAAVWHGKRSIHLLELTIPNNSITGLQEANFRKRNKQEYLSLVGYLECLGCLVRYTTIELGSLGHFLQTANDAISYFLPAMDRCDIKKILIRSSKITISACSHQIFMAHKCSYWPQKDHLDLVTNLFLCYYTVLYFP